MGYNRFNFENESYQGLWRFNQDLKIWGLKPNPMPDWLWAGVVGDSGTELSVVKWLLKECDNFRGAATGSCQTFPLLLEQVRQLQGLGQGVGKWGEKGQNMEGRGRNGSQDAAGDGGSGGNGAHQILYPLSTASLSPFSP